MNLGKAVATLLFAAVACATPATGQDELIFSSDLTEGKVFALARLMIQTGRSELDFVAAEADFNSDGRVDVLTFAMVSDFCGSGGCAPSLFMGTKKGWTEVPFNGLEMPENWYLLDSESNGYRKVAVLGDDSETIYEWDGSAYVRAD